MKKALIVVAAGSMLVWFMIAGNVSGQTTTGPTATASAVQGPPPPPPPGGGATPPPITPPCPPAGCPTATATPAPIPTTTPAPTVTATAIPLTLSAKLARSIVSPRQQQKITLLVTPNADVYVHVVFPNGDGKEFYGTVGTSGKVAFSYIQPGSRITHSNRTARVAVAVSLGASIKHVSKRYTIAFAKLDVSVQPRSQRRGRAVGIWVHSSAGNRFAVTIRSAPPRPYVYSSPTQRTGSDGWAYLSVTIPASASKGRVDVKVGSSLSGARGETSFRVT